MANRIARAIGKDVSANDRFRESDVRRLQSSAATMRMPRSWWRLQTDPAAKILSPFLDATMERMTSLRATFEIPFH
ncbi:MULTISPECIES: hypothetical protein [Bradyrhizobium]|uniref:hypothetical protein n=1 Tax=Bradyrhizobium TaxID=374 RepID=UPI0013A58AA1|nr:hypothetical protein [Bradyrhizobium diazoefficiens]QJS41112.1 hypothetical protein DI395_46525 [Bradyrhizobium diazoefficiens]